MLDKFLVLLERFVVAHELLAANSAKPAAVAVEVKPSAEAAPVAAEEAPAPAKKTRATKAKPAPEPEPEIEEEPEEDKPAPKARASKKQGPDVAELRVEIKEMATHIASGDSDECATEFDELLDEFKVRTVNKLPDEDVEEFHGLAKEIVGKYYEFED